MAILLIGTAARIDEIIGKFHGKNADLENYLFYSRVKSYKSKIT